MATRPDVRQSRSYVAFPMIGSIAQDTLDSILAKIDPELSKLFEDRNVLLTQGGTVTYNGTFVSFTENLKLEINSKVAGGIPTVIDLGAGPYNTASNGDMIYAVINRLLGTAVVTDNASTLPAVVAANQEVFLIAKRQDAGDASKHLYFRNGDQFDDGQASRLGAIGGSAGLGNYITLPEIATPLPPPAGKERFYVKADGKLYVLSSDGTEQPVGAAFYPLSAISQTFSTMNGGSVGAAIGSPSGAYLDGQDVWSASGSTNIAHYSCFGVGSQNAGLLGGSPINTLSVEKFSGFSWSNTANALNTTYESQGSGIQNAALTSHNTNSDKFNGLVWSTAGFLGTFRVGGGQTGSQNASVVVGGYDGFIATQVSEKYNGATWSATGSTNAGHYFGTAVTGSQSAALIVAGQESSFTDGNSSEKFNGSTWSVGPNYTLAHNHSSGHGTQTAALIAGGTAGGIISLVSKFDGTTFSTTTSMSTARTAHGAGIGSGSGATAACGNSPGTTATEKFNSKQLTSARTLSFDSSTLSESTGLSAFSISGGGVIGPEYDIKPYFDATTEATDLAAMAKAGNDNGWATSGNLNVASGDCTGHTGTQSAALKVGGNNGGVHAVCEKFNGSAWSSTGSLITPRYIHAYTGHQGASLAFGGFPTIATAEKFNGSTWSSTGNLSTGRHVQAAAGVQGAALCIGGYNAVYLATCEKFNGFTWSATGSLNTARGYHAGAGSQSAALAVAGDSVSTSEKFNGSTWSLSGSVNVTRYGLAATGVQGAALCIGGTDGVNLKSTTETFNGSVWTLSNDIITPKSSSGSAGSTNGALIFGGNAPAVTAVTEKKIASIVPSSTNFAAEVISTHSLALI